MSSYKELLVQRKKLDAQIQNLRSIERESIIEEIRQQMLDYEISANEITNKKVGKRQNAPVLAKYRDPKSGNEWSGRGKPPAWIKDESNRDKF